MSKSTQKKRDQAIQGHLGEVDVLSKVAKNLREITFSRGYMADNPSSVNNELKKMGLDDIHVSSRHLEALVALGVLGRVISGGESHLAWMSNGSLKDAPSQIQLMQLDSESTVESAPEMAKQSRQDPETNELFKIDVQLDMEHEKLLLYRSLIVVEGIAGLLLLRQMLLWFFQL